MDTENFGPLCSGQFVLLKTLFGGHVFWRFMVCCTYNQGNGKERSFHVQDYQKTVYQGRD